MFFPALIIIDTTWSVFVAVWLALAFNNKRTLYREPLYQRLSYGLAGVVAFLLLRHLSPINHPLFRSPANQIAGAALCILGIAFAVYARLHLGKNWSGIVTLKENHTLIRTGPYRLVRHPIYTGILLAIFGTFLALIPSLAALIVFAAIVIIFVLKLRREESLMRRQFPDEYPAYQRSVKALIPLIY